MARDAALISTWGDTIPGREGKALEVFMELLGYWGKVHADGKCSEPKVYFNQDGSEGVFIVEGKSDDLNEVVESEEFEKLTAKGHLIVQNLRSHLYYGGTDDELTRGTRIFAEAGNELGFM